jgi:hypothetical protein
MYTKNALWSIALLTGLWSCQAANTSFTRPEEAGEPLDRVLVVAMTNNYEVRSMWEKELTYRINSKGFNVLPSINLDEEYKKLYTVDELKELIKTHNLGGILAVRLKDIQRKEGYTQSTKYISQPYGGGVYMYNYLDPYSNVRGWQYQLDEKITIEGNLYDARTEKLIFDSETGMTNAESEEALAGEITESIAAALKKSKLLKPKEN